jgi:hypoxanthine phosphoribosyltransferase
MRPTPSERTLFTADDIARRVREVAVQIARRARRPQIAVPVLTGAFVFAADLLRALALEGVELETEFVWLRSYGRSQLPSKLEVIKGPTDAVRGRNALLIDGVLDRGATLTKARELLNGAGAAEVISAVAVVKAVEQPLFKADYALFNTGSEFLFGYGMDAAGHGRGLPEIRIKT